MKISVCLLNLIFREQVPDAINPYLLIAFATSTGLVVRLMAMCMITTSMMLVYILNYRQVNLEPRLGPNSEPNSAL